MAFSAVAALAAASAETVTATMVLGAVTEIGTAMTVVGAVTGSKTLTKVGGAMSLVGGIGGMVAGAAGGAGAAAGADGLAGSATDAAAGADGLAGMDAAAASDAGNGMAADASAAATAPDASALDQSLGANSSGTMTLTSDSQPLSGTINGAMANPQSTPIASQPVASVDVTGAGTAPAAPPGPQTATAGAGAPDVSTPAGSVSSAPVPPARGITNPADARLATGTQATPMPGGTGPFPSQLPPQDSASYMRRILAFAQDPQNKTVLEMGMKLSGGVLQGIQKQAQFDKTLDLNNRRLAQTSHGSEVGQNGPRRGIISGARS